MIILVPRQAAQHRGGMEEHRGAALEQEWQSAVGKAAEQLEGVQAGFKKGLFRKICGSNRALTAAKRRASPESCPQQADLRMGL